MRFRTTSGIFETGRRCEPSGDWETRPWRIPGPGGGDVVERLLPQDETRTRAVRRVGPPRPGLEDSARRTAARTGIPVGALCAARLTRAVRQARQLVCPVAVRYLGSSGAVAPVHPSTYPR